MSDMIYTQLQEHLDSLPAGYPKTATGAEINILKKFFSPRQAEIALAFKGIMPEKAISIAERLTMDPLETENEIEKMATEGSLFRIVTPDGPVYMLPNFIMGMYEWHVKSIDKETAEQVEHVYDALFEKNWKGRETRQLRVVPIHTSVDSKNIVRSYDAIRELVKGKTGGPYAVAPCICRVEKKLLGETIERPLETCLVFGMVAQYYIQNGIGKELNEQELIEKLDECEEAALIPFSTNTQDTVNMCMCDKDSCQLLRVLSSWEKPAQEVHSAFYAVIDEDNCTGCGNCIKRCQIDAIKEIEAAAEGTQNKFMVDLDRCIGCGLCVPVCRKDALTMKGKEVLPNVPENSLTMNMMMAQEKKKLNI